MHEKFPSNKFLGKDTEHVFEIPCSVSGLTEMRWIPAYRCLIEGKETLLPLYDETNLWERSPKLVKINDIAHLLTPAQLANMKQP